MALSFSQPFAGVGVAYARREEAEAERQHDDVQHGMLLFAPCFPRAARRFQSMERDLSATIPSFRISGCEVPLQVYDFEAAAREVL
jgi:hypothetical protein